MLLIRRCEEAIGRLLNEGLVHGTAHLSIGQEAVPVGFCSELTSDDYLDDDLPRARVGAGEGRST